jgi:hypothetical protein
LRIFQLIVTKKFDIELKQRVMEIEYRVPHMPPRPPKRARQWIKGQRGEKANGKASLKVR